MTTGTAVSRDWLDSVGEIVRRRTRVTYAHLGRNTCTYSSRVLINTLRQLGVRGEPQAVEVHVFDRVSFQQFADGKPIADGYLNYVGPYSKGASAKPDPLATIRSGVAWNAHMLVTVEPQPGAELTAIDVTADQFDRPEVGVSIPNALTFEVEPQEWRDGKPAVLRLPGGGALHYRLLPEDVPEATAYLTSGSWTSGAKTIRGAVDECLRDIAALTIPARVPCDG